MHVHMPKPLHGWREFIGEVGIIVVGVLIALGAEQVVDHVTQEREGAHALRAIRVELGHAGGVYAERIALQPCLDRRIAELGTILSEVRRSHVLPDIGEIGRPSTRPSQSAAWSSAVSKGLVETFPEDTQDLLSVTESQVDRFSERMDEEQTLWARLRVLENQPGSIDPAQLAQAVITLQELRYRSKLNGIIAQQQAESVRNLGIKPDFLFMEDPGRSVDQAAMVANVKQRPICKPLPVAINRA
jgi:hypothetical protein